jgi:hypothetical protein
MLVQINKLKKCYYDEINNLIYQNFIPDYFILNGVSFKHRDISWLILKTREIEGYLEDSFEFEVEILENKKKYKKFNIKNIISLSNKEVRQDIKEQKFNYDCYYNLYLSMMIIKIPYTFTEYDNLNFDLQIDFDNVFMVYYNNFIRKTKKNIKSIYDYKIGFNWEKKYLFAPPVLNYKMIIDKKDIKIEDKDKNMNSYFQNGILFNGTNVVGIVDYINEDSINIISLLSIKKIIDQIQDYEQINYCVQLPEYKIIQIKNNQDNENNIENNKSNIVYGIMFKDYVLSNYVSKDYNGIEHSFEEKVIEKDIVLTKVDKLLINSNGNLIIGNGHICNNINNLFGLQIVNEIPIQSYLFFIKDKSFIINQQYLLEIETINYKKMKKYEFVNQDIILSNNYKYPLETNNYKYIIYKSKNIYLFELNEVFLNLFKKLFQENEKFKDIYEYILKNKYSKNPIILGLRIKKDCPLMHFRCNFKIFKKYKNIDEYVSKFGKKLKQYLKNNLV